MITSNKVLLPNLRTIRTQGINTQELGARSELNYFVGFSPLKERLWAEMESHPDFGQLKTVEPATTLPALPPANDTTFDEDNDEEMPPY